MRRDRRRRRRAVLLAHADPAATRWWSCAPSPTRNFAFGSLFSFILGIGLYGSVYLVPLFLGRVRGYDSLQIGETMFVTGAAMFLSAPDRRGSSRSAWTCA